MAGLQDVALVALAVAGTLVVLCRDVRRQTVLVSVLGLVLGCVFFTFQAPDVALSALAVGAVALPMMILLALAKVRAEERRAEKGGG